MSSNGLLGSIAHRASRHAPLRRQGCGAKHSPRVLRLEQDAQRQDQEDERIQDLVPVAISYRSTPAIRRPGLARLGDAVRSRPSAGRPPRPLTDVAADRTSARQSRTNLRHPRETTARHRDRRRAQATQDPRPKTQDPRPKTQDPSRTEPGRERENRAKWRRREPAMHAGTMGERLPLAALPYTYPHARKIPG